MKKKSLLFLVFTLLVSLSLPVFAKSQGSIIINSKVYQTVIIKDAASSSSLVPISFVKEALQLPLTCSEDFKSIKFIANSAEVELMLNSKKALINQQAVELNAEPRLVNNTLYIPLRFLSETLGFKININPKNNVITLAPDEHFAPIPQSPATLTEIINQYKSQGLRSLHINKANINGDQILLQADLYRIASISKEEYDALKKAGQIEVNGQVYRLDPSLSQETDLAAVSSDGTFMLRENPTFSLNNSEFGLATAPNRYYFEHILSGGPKFELIAKDIPFIVDKSTIIKRYLASPELPTKQLTPIELFTSGNPALSNGFYAANLFNVFFEPELIKDVPVLNEIYMP